MRRFGGHSRLVVGGITFVAVVLWVTSAPATTGSLLPTVAEPASGIDSSNQVNLPSGQAQGDLPSVEAYSGDQATVTPGDTNSGDQATVTPGDISPGDLVSVESGDNQVNVTTGDSGSGSQVSISSGQNQVTISGDQVSVKGGQGAVTVAGNRVTINSDQQVTVSSGQAASPSRPLPTLPPLPTLAPPSPPPASSAGGGTFRLCGGPDPQAERTIAQLIGGRGFGARLSSRPDGCADLTITLHPQPAGSVLGRQTTRLTVSAGSSSGAPAHNVSIDIVTENGVTQVSIGAKS